MQTNTYMELERNHNSSNLLIVHSISCCSSKLKVQSHETCPNCDQVHELWAESTLFINVIFLANCRNLVQKILKGNEFITLQYMYLAQNLYVVVTFSTESTLQLDINKEYISMIPKLTYPSSCNSWALIFIDRLFLMILIVANCWQMSYSTSSISSAFVRNI